MSFKTFLYIVNRLIDKHCPKKRIPKTKCQTKPKPWITPALSNFIKIKNRVYKQFCKASDPIKKRELHERFKNYRNLTTILTRVCKKIIIGHSFRITKPIQKNMGRYKVNCECHKQKVNKKHQFVLISTNKYPQSS